jgi:hypothetical protein
MRRTRGIISLNSSICFAGRAREEDEARGVPTGAGERLREALRDRKRLEARRDVVAHVEDADPVDLPRRLRLGGERRDEEAEGKDQDGRPAAHGGSCG